MLRGFAGFSESFSDLLCSLNCVVGLLRKALHKFPGMCFCDLSEDLSCSWRLFSLPRMILVFDFDISVELVTWVVNIII